MKFRNKRLTIFLGIMMLLAVTIFAINVCAKEAECQISMKITLNGEDMNEGARYEVNGGEKIEINAETLVEGENIEFISYFFYPIESFDKKITVFSNKTIIEVPKQEEGTLLTLYVEAVASNDDGTENTATKTGWKKYCLEYISEPLDENIDGILKLIEKLHKLLEWYIENSKS